MTNRTRTETLLQVAIIHHIAKISEWEADLPDGAYRPPSLASEGFIHCSKVEQTAGTANLYYKAQTDLVILCIDESKTTGEVKYEAPTDGPSGNREDQLFPHLYGALNRDAVVDTVPFPCSGDGSFNLPDRIKGP